MTSLLQALDKLRSNDKERYEYTLNTLIYHLCQAEQFDRVRETFNTSDWMVARFHGSQETYDGYAQDLLRVLDTSYSSVQNQIKQRKDMTEMGTCVRYALLRTSINSLASSYAPKVVRRATETGLWSTERAISVANNIASPGIRALTYVELLLTNKFNDFQKQKAEKQIIEIAFALPDTLLTYDSTPTLALGKLLDTYEYADENDLADTALQKALLFPETEGMDPSPRIQAISALLPHLRDGTRQKALSNALETVLKFDDDYYKVKGLEALVGQLEGDQLSQGLDALFSLRFHGDKVKLIKAATKQLNGNMLHDTVRRIADLPLVYYVRALATLLPQFEINERTDVLQRTCELARSSQDQEDRAIMLTALLPLFEVHEQENYFLEIQTLIPAIENIKERIATQIKFIKCLIGRQKTQVINETIDSILELTDHGDRNELIIELVNDLDADTMRRILRGLRRIPDESKRIIALTNLSINLENQEKIKIQKFSMDRLSELDIHDAAQTIIATGHSLIGEANKQAFEFTLTIDNEADRSRAIASIATNLDTGDVERAFKHALEMRFEGYQVQVIRELVAKLTNKLLKQSLEFILKMEGAAYLSEGIVAILYYLPNNRREKPVRRALNAIFSLDDEDTKCERIVAIAPYLEGDQLARCLQMVKRFKSPQNRAKGLMSLSLKINNKNQAVLQREALDNARAVTDHLYRFHTLYEIAPHLNSEQAEEALGCISDAREDWYYAPLLSALAPHLKPSALDIALTAAKSMKSDIARARTLVGFLDYVEDKDALVLEIRNAILQYLMSVIDGSRDRVLSLLSEKLILPALGLTNETVNSIAEQVINVCWYWEWQ